MNNRKKTSSPSKSPTMVYTTKKQKTVSYLYIDMVDNNDYYEYY